MQNGARHTKVSACSSVARDSRAPSISVSIMPQTAALPTLPTSLLATVGNPQMAQKYIRETIWEIAGDGDVFREDLKPDVIAVLNALVNMAGNGELYCQQARKMAQQLVKFHDSQKC